MNAVVTFLKDKVLGYFTGKMGIAGGFFGVLIVVILVIMIPNLGEISAKLGFTTKATLQKQVVETGLQLSHTLDANRTLSQTIDNQADASQATIGAIVAVNKDEKKNESDASAIIKKETTKIAQIRHRATDKTQPKQSTAEVDRQIATVQITAIWEAYCSFNPDVACQALPQS